MKIIQVINVRWYNATACYAVNLSFLLQQAGHDVIVLTIKDSPAGKKAKELGLKVVYSDLNTSNPLKMFYTSVELLTLLRSFKPDIVNCHRGEFVLFWALAKIVSPYKLIRTRGDQRLPKNNLPNRIIHRYILDAIISTNTNMSSVLIKTFCLPKEKVSTIIGGVNQEVFAFSKEKRESIRKKYSFTEKMVVLGLVGRFDWVKGQKELIEAIGEIYAEDKNTPLRLLLVGFSSGIEQEQVEQWIYKAGIEAITTITGYCEDIPGYICAMDIPMIASLGSETIARVALEVLSCKQALLSTDIGVMPDILPRKYLIPIKDTNSRIKNMKNAILQCLSSPEYMQELLNIGAIARKRLSDTLFLDETEKVYNDVFFK